MAIKDKNGKVFTLRGPNPLLITQQEWDRTQLKFFNLKNARNEVVVNDEKNPVESFKENLIDIGKELDLQKNEETIKTKSVDSKKFIQEMEEIKQVEEVVETKQIVEEKSNVLNLPKAKKQNFDLDPQMAKILKQRGAEYYCAPVTGKKQYTDEFYGDNYSVLEYGEKFIFDAVVVDQSDLELQIWCIKPITSQSIIYKKVSQGGERWWKITQVEQKTGGWLANAIPSEINPDFS